MTRLLTTTAALLMLSSAALAGGHGTGNGNGNGSNNGNGQGNSWNGNFNGNGGGTGSGVGIGVGIGGSASSDANASATGGTATANATFEDKKQAPGIGLAGLAMGGLSCKGSFSVGGSGPGFGIGFAGPVDDDECERRQWAAMLAAAKDPEARKLAWLIMLRSRIIAQAIQDRTQPVYGVAIQGGEVVGAGARIVTCRKWSGGATGVGKCLY